MELVDYLKKVLQPGICKSDQSQDLELEEKQNGMKVRISRTGALVWAMCINTQRARQPLSLKKGYGLICDYLIIVQSGGNNCVVFVEMKRSLGGEAQEKGREQLRRSLALWDYLCSVCKIECKCKIAPDVSVKYVPKYVLIAENPLDKNRTYRAGDPEVSRDQHEGIEIKTLRRTIVSIGELIN